MSTLSVRPLLQKNRVVPVVVLDDPTQAIAAANALLAGGISVIEVTLRTPKALACIEAIAAKLPEMDVLAGTVRTVDDLRSTHKAGAKLPVSPGLLPALVEEAFALNYPLLPGVATASEVMQGCALGLDTFKLFPAEAVGGIALLSGLRGPFGDIMFCPTGGVTLASLPSYLGLANVICVGGSWICPASAVRSGDFDTITKLAAEAARVAAN